MTRVEPLSFLRKHRRGVLSAVSPSGGPEAAVLGVGFTDQLEIIFDTLDSTRKWVNRRHSAKVAFVIGWDRETTVQYEGIADEPKRAELDRLKEAHFVPYPDGRARQRWAGITYFRLRPGRARYSDFNVPLTIFEFREADLAE